MQHHTHKHAHHGHHTHKKSVKSFLRRNVPSSVLGCLLSSVVVLILGLNYWLDAQITHMRQERIQDETRQKEILRQKREDLQNKLLNARVSASGLQSKNL